MVDGVSGSTSIFKNPEFNLSIGKIGTKNTRTTEENINGSVITSIGKINVGATNVSGEMASFAPNIIESPDGKTWRDASGNVRTPSEPYEARGLQLSYGLQLPVGEYKVTAGVGYGSYDGNTPNKSHGLDATDIAVHGLEGMVKVEKGDTSVELRHGQKYEDVMSGYNGYTVYRGRSYSNTDLNVATGISADTLLKANINWKNTDQGYTFTFDPGVPHFFPAKANADQSVKYNLAIEQKNLLGQKSIELGASVITGSELSTLLAIPIQNGYGLNASIVTQNDMRIGLGYEHISSSGDGNYFSATTRDLEERSQSSKWNMSLQTENLKLGASVIRTEKGGHFKGATPVDMLLAGFPDAGQHQTSWDDLTYTLNASYKFTPAITGLFEFGRGRANLNQYGSQVNGINNLDKIKVGINYSF